jgi:hypothetical protein
MEGMTEGRKVENAKQEGNKENRKTGKNNVIKSRMK